MGSVLLLSQPASAQRNTALTPFAASAQISTAWVPPSRSSPRSGLDLRITLRDTVRMTVRMESDKGALAEPLLPPRKIPVNLSLPEDLVAELDAVSGPRNRSAFVEDAVRRAVRREQLRVAIERTAGSLSAEDYPHWRTSEDVVAWVREMRAEETSTEPEPE